MKATQLLESKRSDQRDDFSGGTQAPLSVRLRRWIRLADEPRRVESTEPGSQYRYGMFGEVTQTVGTIASDFQYTGLYYHAPSGLNLATYRAYSPSLGRWINRDPAGTKGGVNLYNYVGNNPISNLDPSGLYSQSYYASDWASFEGPGASGGSAGTYANEGCVGLCSYSTGSKNPTDPNEGAQVTCFANRSQADGYKCPCPTHKYEYAKQGPWSGGTPPTPGAGGGFSPSAMGGPPFNYVTFLEGGLYGGGDHAMYHKDGSFWPGSTFTFSSDINSLLNSGQPTMWCVICR